MTDSDLSPAQCATLCVYLSCKPGEALAATRHKARTSPGFTPSLQNLPNAGFKHPHAIRQSGPIEVHIRMM